MPRQTTHNQKQEDEQIYLLFEILQSQNRIFFMILEADEFKGPYHIIKNESRPFRILVGDFDIYVGQKQNAYLYFSNMKDGVIACKLSDDYLDVVGDYKRYYENLDLPFSREGIAIFEYRNELFMITCGMTSYIPNQSRIARLSSPLGNLRI